MLKKTSIAKSSFLVALFTLFSRLLGFVRDMLIAFLFGASWGLDVFLVAFRIPNLMRALFAEGAFAQAFVPALTAIQHQRSIEESKLFISRTLGLLLLVVLVITIVAEILMPLLVIVFAPGFMHETERYNLAVTMLRITFPYFFFISLTAFFAAVLNSYDKFTLSAFLPVVLNVVMIIFGLSFTSYFHIPELALAWGVLAAGLCQFMVLFPSLLKNQIFLRPRLFFHDKEVKRIIKMLLPSLFGVSIVQIGLFINMLFATYLPSGSISWLYYADRLTFFPLGIVGVGLSTVILPYLSRYYHQKSAPEFNATLDWSLRCFALISIPAMLGLFFLAKPIVVLLFLHGMFTVFDANMTTTAVMAFALGIPGFIAVKILTSAFYARHEIHFPVKTAFIAVLVNVGLNILLLNVFHHVGLAIATTVATTCNALFLYARLYRLKIHRPLPGWKRFSLQLCFANTGIAFFLWYAHSSGLVAEHFGELQSLRVLGSIVLTIIAYFCLLWIAGMRVRDFKTGNDNTTANLLIER